MTIKGFKPEDYFNFINTENSTKYLVNKKEYLKNKNTPDALITCLPTMPFEKAFAPDPIAKNIELPIKNLKPVSIFNK